MVHPISGKSSRNQRVIAAWVAGDNYSAIGKRFGVSAERAYQIVKENAPPELLATKIRAQKPARKSGSTKLASKIKTICINPADFKLIERGAQTRTPVPTLSYYIVQLAVAGARRDLGIPA